MVCNTKELHQSNSFQVHGKIKSHSLEYKEICILTTSFDPNDQLLLKSFVDYFNERKQSNVTSRISISNELRINENLEKNNVDDERNLIESNETNLPSVATKDVKKSNKIPYSIELADKFDYNKVTHLVVTVDKKGILKRRTMKFMQSIMSK